jgi:hypothetical protein
LSLDSLSNNVDLVLNNEPETDLPF